MFSDTTSPCRQVHTKVPSGRARVQPTLLVSVVLALLTTVVAAGEGASNAIENALVTIDMVSAVTGWSGVSDVPTLEWNQSIHARCQTWSRLCNPRVDSSQLTGQELALQAAIQLRLRALARCCVHSLYALSRSPPRCWITLTAATYPVIQPHACCVTCTRCVSNHHSRTNRRFKTTLETLWDGSPPSTLTRARSQRVGTLRNRLLGR
jgi:hypothetical protein